MGTQLIIKSEDERLVYGEVYTPLDVDSQGDAMTPEEIKKMAHNFLAKGIPQNIDMNHDREQTGCVVVESYLAKKDDPDGFTPGAWILGTKVLPDDLWQKVKSGEINGYSFSGEGAPVILETLVDMPTLGSGETEKSLDGPLPPHSHKVVIQFDKNGKPIPVPTEESLSHKHLITKATATSSELGHSHRLIFEP